MLRMHEAVFQEWGAVPEEILCDRMRAIRTGTDMKAAETVWNAVFLDFRALLGFMRRLCRPYRLQTEGKVEFLSEVVETGARVRLKKRSIRPCAPSIHPSQ
jgi:transposase